MDLEASNFFFLLDRKEIAYFASASVADNPLVICKATGQPAGFPSRQIPVAFRRKTHISLLPLPPACYITTSEESCCLINFVGDGAACCCDHGRGPAAE